MSNAFAAPAATGFPAVAHLLMVRDLTVHPVLSSLQARQRSLRTLVDAKVRTALQDIAYLEKNQYIISKLLAYIMKNIKKSISDTNITKLLHKPIYMTTNATSTL
jgi:hypothetical protein